MRGTGSAGGVSVEWGAVTDVGRARTVNEDAVLAEPSVFVVADGMGGHRAGDVASAMVVDRFASLAGSEPRAMDEVVETIDAVNREILEQGRTAESQHGMGTTAVGMLLVDDGAGPSLLVFNIGDSRAYCLTGGILEQLSVDHSYVQELVDAGQISTADARDHPRRNVVTRALGVDESPRPDYWLRRPSAGERYLLCSDGLSSEVDDDMIRAVLLAPTSAADAAAELVRRALEAGGKDNVSVLVLDVLEVDEPADELTDTAPRGLIAAVAGDVVSRAPGPAPASTELLDVDVVPAAGAGASTDEDPGAVVAAELIDGVPDGAPDAAIDSGDRHATDPAEGDDPGTGGPTDG
jgi:serine/threonine protein phosphatase PrpC